MSSQLVTVCFIVVSAAIIWSDIRWFIIPYIAVIPGIVLCTLIRTLLMNIPIGSILLELLLCGTAGVCICIAARGGVGWGDVLLGVLVAAAHGRQTALYALLLAAPTAAVCAGFLLLCGRIDRKSPLPWAPFYLGTAAGIMWLCPGY